MKHKTDNGFLRREPIHITQVQIPEPRSENVVPAAASPTVQNEPLHRHVLPRRAASRSVLPFHSVEVEVCRRPHASHGVCDVKDELRVHGRLRYARAASVDDGDQSAVQFVHVALREEPASAASLVLHLGGGKKKRHTDVQTHAHDAEFDWKHHMFNTASLTMRFFFYHICLRGDAERERVDAAGGENSKVRRQSAAGGQSDLLLKDAAGRQH